MFEIKETSFGLTSLLESIASGLADRAAARSLEVIAFTDPAVPDRIRADSRALRRILTSLGRYTINNANGDDIVLYAEVEKNSSAPAVRFYISGLSPKIASPEHPLKFEDLLKAEINQKSMNLNAANQLASIINGGIQLIKSPVHGTVFTFSITLVEGNPSGFKPPAGLKGARILVVDDNPVNCQAIQGLLEPLGCKVKTLTKGVEVMPTLVRGLLSNASYRLVLLDLQMTGLTGKDVLAAIRKHELARDTRVVMLVPHGQGEKSAAEFGSNCTGILEKPVRRIQLREMVEYSLGLRLDRPGNHKVVTPPPQPVAAEKPKERKVRILIAEDDVFSQQIASLLLSKLGLTVDLVFNGAEALKAVKEKDYDLVFMDMHMPIMTGLEAAREIRKLEGAKREIPIYAMTASDINEESEKRCREAGMNGYLPKPLDMKRISQVISSCLDKEFHPSPSFPKTIPLHIPLEEAPVLDVHAVLPIFDHDFARYKGFLDEFLQNFPKRQKLIETSFNMRDWETLEREAHTIKGVASSLGAMQLSQMAASLESQAKEKQPESITTIRDIHDMIVVLMQRAKDQVLA